MEFNQEQIKEAIDHYSYNLMVIEKTITSLNNRLQRLQVFMTEEQEKEHVLPFREVVKKEQYSCHIADDIEEKNTVLYNQLRRIVHILMKLKDDKRLGV